MLDPTTWRYGARDVHRQVPKPWAIGSAEDLRYLTLALAGEAGELANLICHDWRGKPGDRSPAITDECADVRIYLELLWAFSAAAKTPIDTLAARVEEEVNLRLVSLEGKEAERCAASLVMASAGGLCAMAIESWGTADFNQDRDGPRIIGCLLASLQSFARLRSLDLDWACVNKLAIVRARFGVAEK